MPGHLHVVPNTPDLWFGASLPGFFQGWAQMTWDSGPGTHPPLRMVTLVHFWVSALVALVTTSLQRSLQKLPSLLE